MSVEYDDWIKLYIAAVLETDWSKIKQKIQAAENAQRYVRYRTSHNSSANDDAPMIHLLRTKAVPHARFAAQRLGAFLWGRATPPNSNGFSPKEQRTKR